VSAGLDAGPASPHPPDDLRADSLLALDDRRGSDGRRLENAVQRRPDRLSEQLPDGPGTPPRADSMAAIAAISHDHHDYRDAVEQHGHRLPGDAGRYPGDQPGTV